jgi:hypothetical protein
MNHQQAVKMHASERYLLDELSPEERDTFEQHYFECVECADEVRAVFAFADNAKAVMSKTVPRPAPSLTVEKRRGFDWRGWFSPAFAMGAMAALLLGVTTYQAFLVIPQLERRLETATAPRVIPTAIARATTRGDDAVIRLAPADESFQLILDINAIQPVSSYTCEIYDESGMLRFAVPVPAPPDGSLNLLLPAGGLKQGRYTIKVNSNTTSDNYSFVVQRK